jgi:hypothetical protein
MMMQPSIYKALRTLPLLGLLIKEMRTNKEQSNLQHFPPLMNLMMLYKFIIDKESLKKEFNSEEWSPHREWFFQAYKGSNRIKIQEEFYKFLNKVKLNIPFFDWFHGYTIKK